MCVVYFDVVIQLNIEAQYIFPISLYKIKHLLFNRYRVVFRTESNTRFFKQHFFSTQLQCCLTFSWNFCLMPNVACCLIHIQVSSYSETLFIFTIFLSMSISMLCCIYVIYFSFSSSFLFSLWLIVWSHDYTDTLVFWGFFMHTF